MNSKVKEQINELMKLAADSLDKSITLWEKLEPSEKRPIKDLKRIRDNLLKQ